MTTALHTLYATVLFDYAPEDPHRPATVMPFRKPTPHTMVELFNSSSSQQGRSGETSSETRDSMTVQFAAPLAQYRPVRDTEVRGAAAGGGQPSTSVRAIRRIGGGGSGGGAHPSLTTIRLELRSGDFSVRYTKNVEMVIRFWRPMYVGNQLAAVRLSAFEEEPFHIYVFYQILDKLSKTEPNQPYHGDRTLHPHGSSSPSGPAGERKSVSPSAPDGLVWSPDPRRRVRPVGTDIYSDILFASPARTPPTAAAPGDSARPQPNDTGSQGAHLGRHSSHSSHAPPQSSWPASPFAMQRQATATSASTFALQSQSHSLDDIHQAESRLGTPTSAAGAPTTLSARTGRSDALPSWYPPGPNQPPTPAQAGHDDGTSTAPPSVASSTSTPYSSSDVSCSSATHSYSSSETSTRSSSSVLARHQRREAHLMRELRARTQALEETRLELENLKARQAHQENQRLHEEATLLDRLHHLTPEQRQLINFDSLLAPVLSHEQWREQQQTPEVSSAEATLTATAGGTSSGRHAVFRALMSVMARTLPPRPGTRPLTPTTPAGAAEGSDSSSLQASVGAAPALTLLPRSGSQGLLGPATAASSPTTPLPGVAGDRAGNSQEFAGDVVGQLRAAAAAGSSGRPGFSSPLQRSPFSAPLDGESATVARHGPFGMLRTPHRLVHAPLRPAAIKTQPSPSPTHGTPAAVTAVPGTAAAPVSNTSPGSSPVSSAPSAATGPFGSRPPALATTLPYETSVPT